MVTQIVIPSRGVISLDNMVLDVNGTIALDGQIIPGVDERLDKLGELLDLWLVSADTQGTLASLAAGLQLHTRLLQPGDESAQKAALIEELGARRVVGIGNGANDEAMLRLAALAAPLDRHSVYVT